MKAGYTLHGMHACMLNGDDIHRCRLVVYTRLIQSSVDAIRYDTSVVISVDA